MVNLTDQNDALGPPDPDDYGHIEPWQWVAMGFGALLVFLACMLALQVFAAYFGQSGALL